MNNQKNRFWTFCFSLVPGAGEMYFGLYRQGISIMLLFLLLLIVPIMLNLTAISLLAIVLWFFSFLHVHNLRSLSAENFASEKDCYIWEAIPASILDNMKTKKAFAIVLIFLGAYLLIYSIVPWMSRYIPFLTNLSYYLVRITIGVLILALGIRLISGKKQELDTEQTTEQSVPFVAALSSQAKSDAPVATANEGLPEENNHENA